MTINEEQQQVILEFVFESKETLDSLELTLIRLENVDDIEKIRETMNLIFRPFHTLKGGAGFLQLEAIGKVTHTTENLLQIFRTDPSKWKHEFIDILMKSSDLLRAMLDQVETKFTDEGFSEDVNELVGILEYNFNLLTQQSSENQISRPSEEFLVDRESKFTLEEVLGKATQMLKTIIESDWKSIQSDVDFLEASDLVEELTIHHQKTKAGSIEELFYLPETESSETTDKSLTNSQSDLEPDAQPKSDSDKISSFISNAMEHLESIEGVMLVLDKIPDDVDTNEYLQSALRSFHSIKGNAGFLNQSLIEGLCHLSENALTSIQEGRVKLDESSINTIFSAIDKLRSTLSAISKDEPFDEESLLKVEKELTSLSSEGESNLLGNILIKMGKVKADDIDEAIKQQKTPLGDMLIKMGKASKDDINAALTAQKEEKKPVTSSLIAHSTVTKMQDIRVSIEKLDHLFDLVGELIISESMISRHPEMTAIESESIKTISGQLHRNMRNLQEIVMSIRMVPVSTLFRKMVRVVHDAAKKLNKKVKLDLIGEKTEVDKTLVELITDPLLHIVRNAMDHGLESPEERLAIGKDEEGLLALEAKHVGNEVWVSVIDNGKGLNKERILQRAKERKLIGEDKEFQSDSDIWKLIFEPGFSTAEVVTDFSGRGVGMDVVRKNIEKLRGSIDIHSEKDVGSTFTLKIPLTLSIIDGLLVSVGNTNFAMPTYSIKETLQPISKDIVKTTDGGEMLRLRRRVVPVIRLHKIYEITPRFSILEEGMLLIIEHSKNVFALFVDTVEGQQQIVVKNLPESMTNSPHLSGCTILGDGQVGLILDSASIAKSVVEQKKAL